MLNTLVARIGFGSQRVPRLQRWPFAVAAGVLALALLAAIITWRAPYLGVRRSLDDVVYRIEPAGPGADAGIRLGDRLTHVDGAPIADAVPLFGEKGTGDRLAFQLVRAGRSQTVEVILATPPLVVRLRRSIYVAVALTFWLVGVLVFARQPARRRAQLFFALCLTAAGSLAVLSLIEFQVEWANRLLDVGVLGCSALLIHFHTVFPRPKDLPAKRIILGAFYTLSLTLGLVYLIAGPYRLARYPWYPLLRNGVRLYFMTAVLAALAMLLHTYLTTNYGPVRRRVRLVLFGTALALVPTVSLTVLPDLVRGYPLVPDEIVALGLAAIPLAYGYGILRHNLMDVDLVINRAVVYVTLTVLLILAYLSIVTVVSYVTGDLLAGQPLVGALASLAVAASLVPLRTRVQSNVDRLFYREAYDYQAVVGDVSQRLSRTLHEDNLEDLLVVQVSQAMGLKGAALLLAGDRGRLVAREVMGLETVHPAKTQLPTEGRLVRTLIRLGTPTESERLRHLVAGAADEAEARLLHEAAIRLWVPLVLGDELQGVLLLGAKYVDAFFSREDREILATLAHQAALAAKNLQLVEELRQRMAEIDADKEMLRQVNRQAVQSREAERKKVSRELHDQVIQGVIGLKLQVEHCGQRVHNGAVRAELTQIARHAQGIIDDMRRICADLRPTVIDSQGLTAALHSHLDDFEAQSRLAVRRDFQRDDLGLPEEMELSLFRVVQEALQNVRRHAHATSASVRLTVDDGVLELTVADDGQGFALPARLRDLAHEHHIGLVSMRERVEALGGDLAIRTQPGAGTTVHVSVPLPDRT